MKKFIKAIIIIACIIGAMFSEHRIIMHNLHPYKGDNNTIYIEFMGQVDTYYADSVSEMEDQGK